MKKSLFSAAFSLLILFLIQATAFSQASQSARGVDSGTGGTLDPVQPRADIIAHSPEVEAMVKYGVLPVTLYTAMPQISVPVFEIKTPELTIPFSLNYNYNGFKPAESASWCGLGWSLQGTGSIAKIIKGQPDGTRNPGNNYDDFINVNALAWSQDFLEIIALGQIDIEPDIYIFNIGPYSGKFILIKGQAYLFPFQNLKISSTGTGFKMIDDQGNMYLFNDTETTFTKNSDIPVHTSSWHISKIITASKKDTISYFYNEYSFKQPSTFTDRYTINSSLATGFNTTGHTFTRVPVDGDHIDALVLSSVTSRYGNLSFIGSSADRLDIGNTGAKALDKIVITGPMGSSFQKEIVLVHDYFANNSKLKLKETFERRFINDEDLSVPVIDQHYLFDYQGEDKDLGDFLDAIDYWGFYNGVHNAMLFPPGSFTPALYPYADRNANSAYSSYGIIKKLTYPTGGYSIFEFGQNRTGSYYLTSNYTDVSFTKQASYDPNNQVNGHTEVFKAFTINKAQTVSLTYGDVDDDNIPTIPVVKIYNGSPNTSPIYTSPVYQDQQYNHTDAILLNEGNYYLSVTCENGIAGTDYPYSTFGKLNYKVYQASNTLADGPGLRISRISAFDNIHGATPALVKEYSYNDGIELTKSALTTGSNLYHDCAAYYDQSFLASMRSALSDLAENQFYYGEVTESTQDGGKTGKTVYTFGATSKQLLDVKLKSQTDYKYINSDYIPVKSNTSQYQVITKNVFTGFRVEKTVVIFPAQTITINPTCRLLPSPDATQPKLLNEIYQPTDFYTLTSDYSLLSSTKEIAYNGDGSNTLVNQSNYYYDNADHLFPTRIITSNSNGDQITQELKYPLDYNFNSCILPDAINNNFKNDLQSALGTLNNSLSSLTLALNPYQPYDPNTTANKQAFTNITNQYHCRADFQAGVTAAISNRNNASTSYSTCLNSSITDNPVAWQQSIAWMQLNNIVSPVIEKYTSIKKSDGNEYLLSATRNEYGILNAKAVEPLSIKQTEINTSLLKTTFLANTDNYYQPQLNFFYDKDLNLTGQQKINDLSITYLHGYNQIYPLAEIKNTTFAMVLGALGLTEAQYKTESSAAIPSASYLSKINALRQSLPNAKLTTYTYNPLIGITSVSDTNNITTYYEYDAFDRLVDIKDSNNNILKTYDYHHKQ